jgi:hypothetical protein
MAKRLREDEHGNVSFDIVNLDISQSHAHKAPNPQSNLNLFQPCWRCRLL